MLLCTDRHRLLPPPVSTDDLKFLTLAALAAPAALIALATVLQLLYLGTSAVQVLQLLLKLPAAFLLLLECPLQLLDLLLLGCNGLQRVSKRPPLTLAVQADAELADVVIDGPVLTPRRLVLFSVLIPEPVLVRPRKLLVPVTSHEDLVDEVALNGRGAKGDHQIPDVAGVPVQPPRARWVPPAELVGLPEEVDVLAVAELPGHSEAC
mmetsp:Transcript_2541/g.7603  ORF Transcript_2541/g.7603 Transcript_2541/m.7603 type:complete len:208 (-) Transcript_2541:510-1133(-)